MKAVRVGRDFLLAAALVFSSAAFAQEGSEQPQSVSETSIKFATSDATLGLAEAIYTSVPIELGLWEQEGLNVEILPFPGSVAAVQAVGTDRADIGAADASIIAAAIQKAGQDFKAFYTVIPRDFANPMIPQGSKVRTIEDLAGATVGVLSLESGAVPVIKVLAQRAGVDPTTIQFVAIGRGADAEVVIRANRVDVVALWDGPHAELMERGVQLTPLATRSLRQLGFKYELFAKAEYLEANKEALSGFARAVAKATIFAKTNPEATVRIHWKHFPTSKPTGVAEDTAMAQARRILEARLSHIEPIEGRWGYSSPEDVSYYLDIQAEAGVLDERMSPDVIWDGSLVDAANDFEVDAFEQEAATYKFEQQ